MTTIKEMRSQLTTVNYMLDRLGYRQRVAVTNTYPRRYDLYYHSDSMPIGSNGANVVEVIKRNITVNEIYKLLEAIESTLRIAAAQKELSNE